MNRMEYYMKAAELTAERSTCRVHVGAVAVRGRHIIMTSYNGAPSGMDECKDVGCHMVHGHCQRAIHAEQNIITQCARNGIILKDAVIYVTHQPCGNCLKLMISSGVKEVYFHHNYEDDRILDEYYNHIMHIKIYKNGELK